MYELQEGGSDSEPNFPGRILLIPPISKRTYQLSLKSVTSSIHFRILNVPCQKAINQSFINYQTIKLYEIVPHHSEKNNTKS